jgi:hypothetical protein
MLPEIATAWTATTAVVKGLTAALKAIKDVEAKQAISAILDDVIDLQSKLFSAQAQYEALAEAKRDVEEKLVAYKKWDSEAARYDLKEIVSGIFVYVLKDDHAAGDPVHWLCPNCFQEGKKSILQKPRVDYLNHHCHRCQFDIVTKPVSFPSGNDLTATYEPEY